MKHKFEPIKQDLTFLDSEFSECKFQCFTVSIIPDSDKFITAFICTFDDGKKLSSLWKEISSVISAEYQSSLEDEFSCWNIYILYMPTVPIEKSLHYEIENDKFFARKIVIDYRTDTSTVEKTITLLNNRILCTDIMPIPVSTSVNPVQSIEMSEITNALLAAGLPLGNKDAEKRLRLDWINSVLTGSHSHEA